MKISYRKFFVACAAAGLTFSAAATKAGVSSFVLSSIKQGKNVNTTTAGKLATALGVPVTDLLADE